MAIESGSEIARRLAESAKRSKRVQDRIQVEAAIRSESEPVLPVATGSALVTAPLPAPKGQG